jgi:hypothetical protein
MSPFSCGVFCSIGRDNAVHTAKYTLLTFLPRSLLEQVSFHDVTGEAAAPTAPVASPCCCSHA